MNEEKFNKLINERPILVNAIIPSVIIGLAMCTLLGTMSLIQWIL